MCESGNRVKCCERVLDRNARVQRMHKLQKRIDKKKKEKFFDIFFPFFDFIACNEVVVHTHIILRHIRMRNECKLKRIALVMKLTTKPNSVFAYRTGEWRNRNRWLSLRINLQKYEFLLPRRLLPFISIEIDFIQSTNEVGT